MKIVKISSSFSCKKQIRQYEPVDVFMAAEAEVDSETENIKEAQRELFATCKEMVNELISKLSPASTPNTSSNGYGREYVR